MPDEAEAHALLALMLINDARSAARFRDGQLVLLDDQDRSLWDQQQIEEGRALLERALALHGGGPYVIQAAIADLHLEEPHDWEEIALLYQRLEQITGSPVVTMNRAIAVAELEGPQAALALLDRLELDDYRYYHSTRADLLRRLGRDDEARDAYARALELTRPGPSVGSSSVASPICPEAPGSVPARDASPRAPGPPPTSLGVRVVPCGREDRGRLGVDVVVGAPVRSPFGVDREHTIEVTRVAARPGEDPRDPVGPLLETQPCRDRLAAEPLAGRVQQQVEQLAGRGSELAIQPSRLFDVIRRPGARVGAAATAVGAVAPPLA